jgi:hydrogenase maturation protease
MSASLPQGVLVKDYGTRGLDLAYALLDDYEAVVLLDAAPLGKPPGTLALMEVPQEPADPRARIEAHGMDPVKVLKLARSMGAKPAPTYVLACQPETPHWADAYEDVQVGLSEPVLEALPKARQMAESFLMELRERGGNQP